MTKATHQGSIDLGNGRSVPCYVLDDAKHTRVLSRRGLAGALDIDPSKTMQRASEYIAEKSSCHTYLRDPIVFEARPRASNRVLAACHGFDTDDVADFCEGFMRAKMDGSLPEQYHELADQCMILVMAYARIGLTALVDEATGFQEAREKDELQKLLKLYVAEALMPWTKRFPDDFFKHMFRLRGWSWSPGQQGPRYAGKLVNYVIYDRMPPGVLDELKKLNPRDGDGHRKHKQHQRLTENHGVKELDHRVMQATTLMEIVSDWHQFVRLLNRVSPPACGQLQLGLEEEIEGANQ